MRRLRIGTQQLWIWPRSYQKIYGLERLSGLSWIRTSWVGIPGAVEFLKRLFQVVEFLHMFESAQNWIFSWLIFPSLYQFCVQFIDIYITVITWIHDLLNSLSEGGSSKTHSWETVSFHTATKGLATMFCKCCYLDPQFSYY